MSGLMRPSDAGPRLENELMSSILFAAPSISVRRFSELAVEMTFLATFGRVKPDAPELPAENRIDSG